MMEAKDYWTLGMSAAALFVSAGALTVSIFSFALARRRDQRELDATQPLIKIEAPDCDGLGPWTFKFTITNRDDGPIELVRLVSDDRRVVSLTYGETFPVSLADMTDAKALNYAEIRRSVPVGGSLSFKCDVQPYRGKRVGSDAEASFALEYRRASDTAIQRRVQRIILNP